MAYEHVLAPLEMRSIRLKNRVVRAAHGTTIGAQEPGGIGPNFIGYHLARAHGGVGLSILEVCSVHPSCYGPMRSYDPGIADGYRRIVDAIAPTGMRLMQQLWHAGHSSRQLDGSPPWAPSDIASPLIGIVPQPMTKAMIDEIVGAYAKGAALAHAAGLDGIEIHAAHTYLVQQFLSPALNKREDNYGGSLENRMRFLMEILQAVRNEIGEERLLSVRIGPDGLEDGMTVAENHRLLAELERSGLIDFVNLSLGSYFDMPSMIATMSEPAGYMLPTDDAITAGSTIPRLVTGRFRTLAEADQVIKFRQADMVSMVRATIADPHLVRKTMAGREDDVRPCIACNQACVGNINRGGLTGLMPMSCAVNPTTSKESTLRDDEVEQVAAPRRVLVIGGGPAGMEAARVAALRGHRVTLVEASKSLGGQINLGKLAPFRHTIGDIIDWQERQIYALGVEVRLNTYMTADDVRAEQADAVIVATGSTPRMDGVNLLDPSAPTAGVEQGHVVSSHDVMTDKSLGADASAVVSDDIGHYEAIAVAETLLARGAEVTLVTRFNALAPQMDFTFASQPAKKRLHATGRFRVIPNAAVSRVGNGIAALATVHRSIEEDVTADLVVLVSANHRNCEIYDELRDEHPDIRVIGDARAPQFIEAAIGTGNAAGRAV